VAEQIIDNSKSWGVRECICKHQQKLLDNPCKYGTSKCIQLHHSKENYFDGHKITKTITKEEIFKSDLQRSVFKKLQSQGYQVLLNFEVGMRTIDIVAQGEDRQRLAIQCDGERIKTQEELLFEMEYYMTLRRLNWDIFHIRSTQYYTDPDKTFQRLLRRLKQAGITPTQAEPTEPKNISPDLYERVTKKANNIRIRWNEPIKPLSMRSEKTKEPKTA